MKQVEITTSNHVAIEYELASVSQRVVGSILDIVVGLVWLYIVVSMADSSSTNYETKDVLYIIFMIPYFFYSLVAEAFFNGQTLGKYAMGAKVVRMDGKNPGLGEATIRWAFRLVDIWFSAGAIALLRVSSSERAQRIGDTLANTTVINLKPKNVYSINDILSIKDTKKHKPAYPGVVQFTDDDMLLLKNALDRAKKYPTKEHKALLKELASRIKEKLQLGEVKEGDGKFLKTVLQDYIVLTRS